MYSKIFGKIYKFNCDSKIQLLLDQILGLYESPMETEYADVEITFTECLPKLSGYSQNPSVHKYSSKQLQMKFGNIWVAWEYNKILEKKCLLIFAKLPKFNFIMYNLRRISMGLQWTWKICPNLAWAHISSFYLFFWWHRRYSCSRHGSDQNVFCWPGLVVSGNLQASYLLLIILPFRLWQTI